MLDLLKSRSEMLHRCTAHFLDGKSGIMGFLFTTLQVEDYYYG